MGLSVLISFILRLHFGLSIPGFRNKVCNKKVALSHIFLTINDFYISNNLEF